MIHTFSEGTEFFIIDLKKGKFRPVLFKTAYKKDQYRE
jgi:hypothetical protein